MTYKQHEAKLNEVTLENVGSSDCHHCELLCPVDTDGAV